MTCTPFKSGRNTGWICWSPIRRLRLSDGTCVFMEWHTYGGPTFFRDKNLRRMIDEWWTNPLICAALDWFTHRDYRS
jgi:hypothetical protein